MVQVRLTEPETEFCRMLENPVNFFEFFWSKPEKGTYWAARDYQIEMASDRSDYFVASSGRDTGKTTDLERDMVYTMVSNTKGEREGMFTAPNDIHLKPVMERVLLRLGAVDFFGHLVQRKKRFPFYEVWMKNGYHLEARIPGNERGENLLGPHVHDLWVDESQIYPPGAVQQFQQCLRKGCRIRVYGVPNGVRDSYLYQCKTDDEFSKHRIPAWRNPEFDSKKKRRLVKRYHGDKSQVWLNNVEALDGEPQIRTFDMRDYERCESRELEYDSVSLQKRQFIGFKYSDVLKLPAPPTNSEGIIISGDIGVSPAPTIIGFWSLFQSKWRLFHKIVLSGVPTFRQAGIFHHCVKFYRPFKLAFDATGIGRNLAMEMSEKTEYTSEIDYTDILVPVEFGGNVLIGYDQEGKEVKQGVKFYSTELLKTELSERGILLPHDPEMKNEFQSSTAKTSPRGTVTYAGEDHHLDMVRCFCMAKFFLTNKPMEKKKKAKKFVGYALR